MSSKNLCNDFREVSKTKLLKHTANFYAIVLSVISYQLSVISYQLLLINY